MSYTKTTIKRLHAIMLVCLFSVFAGAAVFAQHTVSGVVKDVNGEPIIGANVVEKGTTNGSITDIDGKMNSVSCVPIFTLILSNNSDASHC